MSKAAVGGGMALAGGIAGALGSSGPTSQTQTSSTTLPNWVNNTGEANLQQGVNVAQNMLGPYTGARVATMTPGAQADVAALQGNVGASNPAYNVAMSGLSGLTNFAMPNVNPGSIAGTDLSSYMNPYTQNVINSGMQAIDQQRQQALNTNADQAISQGAFGGSRQGVQEGVTNAQAALGAGQLASQLGMQNVTNAQQLAGQDVATNLQGQVANQNAAATGAGINLAGANGLAGVAGQQQNSYLQSLMGALQGQGMMQQDTQNQLNANQQAYGEAQQFPVQQLQLIASLLGQTPYGTTTSGSSSLPSGNPIMGGLGGALTGLGAAGSLFGKNGAFPLSN